MIVVTSIVYPFGVPLRFVPSADLDLHPAYPARVAKPSPARTRPHGSGTAAGAIGFALLGPRFDARGQEWAWYAEVSRKLDPAEPLVLLYDDWDRDPYPTPFGPVPHDLAVRLFYLDRPGVTWHRGPETLRAPSEFFAVIARERDRPALERLGRIEKLAQGPTTRWDRTFILYRIQRSRAPDEDDRRVALEVLTPGFPAKPGSPPRGNQNCPRASPRKPEPRLGFRPRL